MITFPTAREIAVAIVTAARLHDECPILTVEGAHASRGRWLAIAALQEAFPGTPHDWIPQACGLPGRLRCMNARSEIRFKRSSKYPAKWFREADLDIVKGPLAAEMARTGWPATTLAPVVEVTTPAAPKLEPDCQPRAPSAAAHALADFHRSRIAKTARGPSEMAPPVTPLEDRTRAFGSRSPLSVSALVMGDPAPGRSALDQRHAQASAPVTK